MIDEMIGNCLFLKSDSKTKTEEDYKKIAIFLILSAKLNTKEERK